MSDNLTGSGMEAEKKLLNDKLGVSNPIAIGVDRLEHRIRDIENCIRFLPNVREQKKFQVDEFWQEIKKAGYTIWEAGAVDIDKIEGYLLHKILQGIKQFDRWSKTQPDRVMARSLFLGLFATFEAYMGDLLTAIFPKKPELFNLIGNTVPVSEIVSAQSIDEIKSRVLTEYIENFRRKSYIEQFESMEHLFSIELRKFGRWPEFVEASQRRNVMAHCDGMVNQQYLENCRRAGCSVPTTVTLGSLLEITDDYLADSCRVVMEVGVKLAHTLWRKLLPQELSQADIQLSSVTYSALEQEEWSWAAILGEFAIGQRNFSNECHKRIAIINHAIAIRYRDGREAARKIMATKDWSASAAVYRLAEAILNDDEKKAVIIMRELGKGPSLEELASYDPSGGIETWPLFIGKLSYQTWALFREFRTTKVFLDTYQEIYGHDFISELQETLQKQGALSARLPVVT